MDSKDTCYAATTLPALPPTPPVRSLRAPSIPWEIEAVSQHEGVLCFLVSKTQNDMCSPELCSSVLQIHPGMGKGPDLQIKGPGLC